MEGWLHCVDHLGMTVVLNSFNCPKTALDKVMIFMDLNVLGPRRKQSGIITISLSVIVYIVQRERELTKYHSEASYPRLL